MKKQKQKNQQQPRPKKNHNLKDNSTTELTFLEHLHELRRRVSWVVATLVVTTSLGFTIKDTLTAAIMHPLGGGHLIYLTPAGGFSFVFTICLYFGILMTIPVASYQVYGFIRPLIRRVTRRFIATFIALSMVLAVAGACFGYFVTIPSALDFLSKFAGQSVTSSLTADSYVSFIATYVLGLAILFQIPLLLYLADRIKPIPPGFISGSQNYVILGAAIIAALITPTPDIFNMMIVAVPVITIYEVGAFIVFMRRVVRRGKPSQSIVQSQIEEPIEQTNIVEVPAAAPVLATQLVVPVVDLAPALGHVAVFEPGPTVVPVAVPITISWADESSSLTRVLVRTRPHIVLTDFDKMMYGRAAVRSICYQARRDPRPYVGDMSRASVATNRTINTSVHIGVVPKRSVDGFFAA